MLFTLAVLAAGAAAADDADAKALFAKMEAAVLKAKTYQTHLAVTASTAAEAMADLKGRVLVAEGNKLRMEFDGKIQGKAETLSFVSDGAKMRLSGKDKPGRDQDVEKEIGKILLASASRTGVFFPLFFAAEASGKKEPFDVDTDLAVSDFKYGKKEKVGDAEAQAVEYTLKARGTREPIAVAVWIDPKTSLPVKRTLTVKEGKETVTLTETYTKTALGEKIDEKEFALPK